MGIELHNSSLLSKKKKTKQLDLEQSATKGKWSLGCNQTWRTKKIYESKQIPAKLAHLYVTNS